MNSALDNWLQNNNCTIVQMTFGFECFLCFLVFFCALPTVVEEETIPPTESAWTHLLVCTTATQPPNTLLAFYILNSESYYGNDRFEVLIVL